MPARWILLGLAAAIGGIFLFNAPFWGRPSGSLTVMSHRGVHHDYSREGLERDDCTATRIFPPTHDYLENTLRSMQAAFAAGADAVEIDVHPTTDGDFAVFHDWTIDCRTEGQGVTREQSMAYLRALDVGYGYTADGGRTFPFRGKGVGLMPNLREVLLAFPERRFLINFKSRDASEGDAMMAYLRATPGADVERLSFYGADPARRVRALLPNARVVTRKSMVRCGRDYLLLGWTGATPATCNRTIVFVPANIGWLLWGWPDLFLARMQGVGTEVIVVAPLKPGEAPGVGGIDDAATFARVPRGWRGGVATDAIEVVGPLARTR